MRLGEQECKLSPGSLVHELYGSNRIAERHRHRYEFNNTYMESLQEGGLSFTGISVDDALAEVVEISGHPWFVGCQFHPEFTSTPRAGHPLFTGFVRAAHALHNRQIDTSEQDSAQEQIAPDLSAHTGQVQ